MYRYNMLAHANSNGIYEKSDGTNDIQFLEEV